MEGLFAPRLTVGRYVADCGTAFGRTAVPILCLSVIPALPSEVLGLSALALITNDSVVLYFAARLLIGAISLFVSSALSVLVVHALRHDEVSLSFCLRRVVVSLPSLAVLCLAYSIALALGTALFLVPGIVAFVCFLVAAPCCVLEKASPSESLRRSLALTQGSRWPLFGGLALFWGLMFLLSGGSSFVSLYLLESRTAYLVTTAIIAVVESALVSVGVGVAYHHLCLRKEGGNIDKIASQFA